MKRHTLWAFCLAFLAAGLPGIAHAYVGPGAGLSLVAAFWAILVAVGTIVVFTLMWPIRRMMRRKSAGRPASRGNGIEDRPDGIARGRGAHGS